MNTAPDSENKIHDDATASAYGFRGGLVPGVTVYGYMTAAAIEHFGREWLDRGAMDLRLLQPVYAGDEVTVTSELSGGRLRIGARVRHAALHRPVVDGPLGALLAGVVSVLVVRTENVSPNAPEAISPNANRTASPIPIRRDRFRSVR